MAIVNYLNFSVISQPDPTDPKKTNIHLQHGQHGLFSGGLVMDLAIGVDAFTASGLQRNNSPVPPPIITKGLLDTGCTITSIDTSLVEKLGLKVRGYENTGTANGMVQVTKHAISLMFPNTQLQAKPVQSVQSVNLSGQPFLVLIGRDLMANWKITYNGLIGLVSIAD